MLFIINRLSKKQKGIKQNFQNFYFNLLSKHMKKKHKINCWIQHFYKNMSIKGIMFNL